MNLKTKKLKTREGKRFIKIESIRRKRDSKISTTSLRVRKQKILDTVIIKSLEGCIEIYNAVVTTCVYKTPSVKIKNYCKVNSSFSISLTDLVLSKDL